MLLDVAWPGAFQPRDTQSSPIEDAGLIEVCRFLAPDGLGQVDVSLSSMHTRAAVAAVEPFRSWQLGGHQVHEARERVLSCRHGQGRSYAAELGETATLAVTYLMWIEAAVVVLRTAAAPAVVIGAVMLELDEIAWNLNLRPGD